MREITPQDIAPPFARYAHGVEVPAGHRLIAYVTGREHMAGYMAARDEWLADITRLPASTLVIVSGFTRPEFVVEIEVLAALPNS